MTTSSRSRAAVTTNAGASAVFADDDDDDDNDGGDIDAISYNEKGRCRDIRAVCLKTANPEKMITYYMNLFSAIKHPGGLEGSLLYLLFTRLWT